MSRTNEDRVQRNMFTLPPSQYINDGTGQQSPHNQKFWVYVWNPETGKHERKLSPRDDDTLTS